MWNIKLKLNYKEKQPTPFYWNSLSAHQAANSVRLTCHFLKILRSWNEGSLCNATLKWLRYHYHYCTTTRKSIPYCIWSHIALWTDKVVKKMFWNFPFERATWTRKMVQDCIQANHWWDRILQQTCDNAFRTSVPQQFIPQKNQMTSLSLCSCLIITLLHFCIQVTGQILVVLMVFIHYLLIEPSGPWCRVSVNELPPITPALPREHNEKPSFMAMSGGSMKVSSTDSKKSKYKKGTLTDAT